MTEVIYQLAITLEESSPKIWRKLLVEGSTKLPALHTIFQIALGWQNSHLYLFRTVEGIEYSVPHPEDMIEMRDCRRVSLSSLASHASEEFFYLYDFGDHWLHSVVVEKILEVDPRKQYPLCIGGARACPPEDCRGIDGYYELLENLSEPDSEEHDSCVTWVGGVFDSEGFDLNRVNRDFEKLQYKRRRKMKKNNDVSFGL